MVTVSSHPWFPSSARLRLVVGVVLSMPALARLALPDIGAETVPGPLLFWLDRWWGWWVVIVLVALLVGLGRMLRTMPLLRDAEEPGLLGMMLDIGLGLWALCTSCLVLAAVNLFHGAPMAVLATTLVGAGSIGLLLRARESTGLIETGHHTGEPPAARLRWWWIPPILAVLAWLLPLWMQTLLPSSEWDGTAAHLPLASKLVRDGLWFAEPEYFHYHNPANVHLLYGLLLDLRAEAALVPLNLAVAVGTAVIAFALAQRLWGRRAGLWALAVTMATTLLWELGVDLRVDGFLALTSALSTAAFVLWAGDRKRPGLLIACAAIAGLTAGIKPNGLIPTAALVAAVGTILALELWHQTARLAWIVAALLVAAPSGIWYLRNVIELGQPIYPVSVDTSQTLHRNVSGEIEDLEPAFRTFVDRHLGADQLSVLTSRTVRGIDLSTQGIAHLRRKLYNLWDLVRNPRLHTRKRLHWITPVLFFGFLLPIVRRDRRSVWLWLVVVTTALVVGGMTYLVRYALFLVPLLAVAAGGVLTQVRSRLMRLVIATFLVGQIAYSAAAEWHKLASSHPREILTGESSRLAWFAEVGYSGAPGMARLTLLLNAMVRDGRADRKDGVLMVGEGKGYDLFCRFVPDPGRICGPWLGEMVRADGDLERIAASLDERQIRFIVLNRGFLSWSLRESMSDVQAVAVALDSLDRFLDHHAQHVATEAWIDLYELNAPEKREDLRR